jgi:nucleoside-diphosphate-sugar epimerase
VNDILSAADLPPVTRRIPRHVALAAGAISELAYRALRIKGEPRLTRFLVRELSTAHWFAISAARRDLGYRPRVSIEEGMRRLRAWLRDRRLGDAEDSLDELDDQVDDEEDAE